MLLFSNIDQANSPKPEDANYAIPTLNVAPDFPISIARDGRVLSVHGDDTWDISPYAGVITRFHFGTIKGIQGKLIDRPNIKLYKLVMMWVMYAWGTPLATGTIRTLFNTYKGMLKLCIDNGILVSDLHRYPKVYNQLPDRVKASQWKVTYLLLQRLYSDRDFLGFIVLTYEQIEVLNSRYTNYYTSRQTPYIPERIYYGLITSCSEIVETFLAHKEGINALYGDCLEAALRTRADFGCSQGLGIITTQRQSGGRRNINAIEFYTGRHFSELATEYGVLEQIEKFAPRRNSNTKTGLPNFSRYLSTVMLAARILIAGLSAMRDKEHGSLRVDCYETREDELLGTVCFLKGKTTKTQQDNSAYWATSPIVGLAVTAAKSIAELRYGAAKTDPRFNTLQEYASSPLMFQRSTDPWSGGNDFNNAISSNSETAKNGCLGSYLLNYRLFTDQQLTITEEDLAEALRLTPDLDLKKFRVGATWPLAWHQFRRTFVCLALGSGVSMASLAWQLKHGGPAMTRHYGNNYFHIPLDADLRREFERTQLEIFLLKSLELNSDSYVATTKGKKDIAIRCIKYSDEKSLKEAARSGKIAIKRTALGVCTNPEPCPFGGWEHVAECIGCVNALAYTGNRPRIERMLKIVEADISECNAQDTLLSQSLVAQRDAIMEALHVIS